MSQTGARKSHSGARVHREVVSFVRRSSRMTSSQRRVWDRYHDRFLIEVPRGEIDTSVAPTARLDLSEVFGRTAPLIVEIGPGMGDSLVPMAKARSNANVLAFEVYQPAVAGLMVKLRAEHVDNVRIVQVNGVDGLEYLVPDSGLDRLWLFFPDPWPKARHRKRRLVNDDFAGLVARKLSPGGRWRIATDWADYAGHIRDVLDEQPAFENPHPGGWAPRWSKRPLTRFEQRGLAAGRHVFDLTYVRRGPGAERA
ncbi:MAG: tRNA (guanosine(46)-N7)-methyltransferase TrmB [Propionibacteriaceae bacterium]